MWKIQNKKTFLQRPTFQLVKTYWTIDMLLVISMVKKLLEHYIKKKVETSQTKFRVEKLIKRKGCTLNGRDMMIHSIAGLI